MELPKDKWTAGIGLAEIGAAVDEGGSRAGKVKAGGHTTLPFLDFEGECRRPLTCLEVHDTYPEEWPEVLKSAWGEEILKDPVKWAKKAESYNPDLLCFRLFSCDPDRKNTFPAEAAALVRTIIKNTRLPLIITGCGIAAKDTEVLPEVIDAAKGERCLFGIAVKDNFKTVAAACMSSGHLLIAETPLDINLAKQLNILITDLGFPVEKIIMHHSTGALGYGIEYAYSVMERTRLAGLSGDKMMSSPMISFIGQEVWKSKEAKTLKEELPKWGDEKERAINWETATAACYLQAGSDILVLNHPDSLKSVAGLIDSLLKR